MMMSTRRRDPADREAIARIKEWTRARFALSPEASLFVGEIACGLPGCPPLETVIVFWTDTDRRHRCKVFKPLREVTADDLPPAWMKEAILDDGLPDCC